MIVDGLLEKPCWELRRWAKVNGLHLDRRPTERFRSGVLRAVSAYGPGYAEACLTWIKVQASWLCLELRVRKTGEWQFTTRNAVFRELAWRYAREAMSLVRLKNQSYIWSSKMPRKRRDKDDMSWAPLSYRWVANHPLCFLGEEDLDTVMVALGEEYERKKPAPSQWAKNILRLCSTPAGKRDFLGSMAKYAHEAKKKGEMPAAKPAAAVSLKEQAEIDEMQKELQSLGLDT